MIYFKLKNGNHLVLLEPTNFDRLKEGRAARSHDGEVVIVYVPDPVWMEEQIQKRMPGLDSEELEELLNECLKREPVKR